MGPLLCINMWRVGNKNVLLSWLWARMVHGCGSVGDTLHASYIRELKSGSTCTCTGPQPGSNVSGRESGVKPNVCLTEMTGYADRSPESGALQSSRRRTDGGHVGSDSLDLHNSHRRNQRPEISTRFFSRFPTLFCPEKSLRTCGEISTRCSEKKIFDEYQDWRKSNQTPEVLWRMKIL